MTGAELAAAAEALVGCRFRLHGRDPATGLDCIGVLAAAVGRAAELPTGYRLRSRTLPRDLDMIAAQAGFASADGGCAPGDVVLLRVGPCQVHLAIAAANSRFVHAHAGLRRVVLAPGPLPWPTIGHWRPIASD